MKPLSLEGGGRALNVADHDEKLRVYLTTGNKHMAFLLDADQEDQLLGYLLERRAQRIEKRADGAAAS